MYVAVGQFAVTPDWNENAEKCVSLMHQAKQKGASLLVLPEALLARDDGDPDLSVKSAQTLEGAFLKRLLAESVGNTLTTILTVHVPSSPIGTEPTELLVMLSLPLSSRLINEPAFSEDCSSETSASLSSDFWTSLLKVVSASDSGCV